MTNEAKTQPEFTDAELEALRRLLGQNITTATRDLASALAKTNDALTARYTQAEERRQANPGAAAAARAAQRLFNELRSDLREVYGEGNY